MFALKLFDAHNHIQDARIFPRHAEVMRRAGDAGVEWMAVKGTMEEDWERVIQLHESYENVHMSVGLHPWFLKKRTAGWKQALEGLLTGYPQAAVGEIGIDHAVEERDDETQEAVFLAQLEIAQHLERPVSIHCRQAWGRLIELLDEAGELPAGMLIHCFGGSVEIGEELIKRGAHISFSGSITRVNNKKAGPALRAFPADRILIETDAPDLTPRGASTELNEPSNLRLVLEKAAELRGMDPEALARLTFENTARFFRL